MEFPTRHAAEAAYNDLRLFNEQIDGQVPSTTSISDLGGPIKITTVADNAFAPTERQTTAEATHWQQIREIVLSGLIPGPTPHNVQERRGRKCLKCRFEKRKVIRSYNAELVKILSQMGSVSTVQRTEQTFYQQLSQPTPCRL